MKRAGLLVRLFALAALAASAAPRAEIPAVATRPPVPTRVAVDAAHHNYHTIDGRYAPFAALLRLGGFDVTASRAPFTPESLDGIDVLVVANALHSSNVDNWREPTPSAFAPGEIAAVERWVARGGALLLIVDHFPFAGAGAELAAAFGFRLANGYALDAPPAPVDRFTRAAGTLKDHPITRGARPGAQVSVVATFTGSAFDAPPDAEPLIELPPGFAMWLPSAADRLDDATPREPAGGRLQAATLRHGRGRVALFAEAALFTAQLRGDPARTPMGFNAPEARDNARLVLNTVEWLAEASAARRAAGDDAQRTLSPR